MTDARQLNAYRPWWRKVTGRLADTGWAKQKTQRLNQIHQRKAPISMLDAGLIPTDPIGAALK